MPTPTTPRFVDRVEDLPTIADLAALSGIEIMQALLAGRLPMPPICRTVGFDLIEASEGRVVFAGEPGFQHYNMLGGAHGGWFGTLLDSCMGCAVHSCLPRGKAFTTLEYKVNIIRPAGQGAGPLQAIGQATHVGRRTAVAEGRLVDSTGKLFAQGSTTCLIFDL
ncbi:MAG TPA: PaaI family thioesterase [Thermohalobaculum sp.]|nr:PaaI family thioesterase [Thermohalobaculum sp.]